MKDFTDLDFHPLMEKLVGILSRKTQNEDPVFFRLMVSYFFCKLASMMRLGVEIADSHIVPVNMYAINLAPSGSGKGHSIGIIEDQVIDGFRQQFLDKTFPVVAEANIKKVAIRRSRKYQTDPDFETQRAESEFEDMGPLLFSFDSALV